jgi:hypothetical protein
MAQQSESELFVKTGHERARTRQTAGEHGLAIQFARTDPRKYSSAVRSVDHWNKLPEKKRASPSGESFKRRLTGHDE